MSAFYQPAVNPMLPWESSKEESSRFKKILFVILIFCLVGGVIVPLIDVPKDVRVINKVPDRLVRLVMEQKKIKIPPPPPEPKKEEKREEKKEEPKKEEKKEKPKPEVKKEQPKPAKSAKQVAEEKAAVFDMFADIQNDSTVESLKDSTNLSQVGSQQVETKREIIGNSAMKDSGGINVGVASSTKGSGTNLQQRGSTSVTSKIKGVAPKNTGKGSGGTGGMRTAENIQLVFDKSYGKIFTPYNRALRANPSLQGTVVFKLRIEPSGKVSKVSIVKSALNDPKLERRILSVIKRLNFGAKNVKAWEDTYSIVFTPQ